MSTWCLLATSSSEALNLETAWNVAAILLSSLIAVVAANYAAERSARLTMANARELQDRERRAEEKALAELLSADLRRKLLMLVLALPKLNHSTVDFLERTATSTSVLEAALPKLGALGHSRAFSLLGAFNEIPNLIHDASYMPPDQELGHLAPQVRDAALFIGEALPHVADTVRTRSPRSSRKRTLQSGSGSNRPRGA